MRQIQVRVREIDATAKPLRPDSGNQISWKLGKFFSEASKVINLLS